MTEDINPQFGELTEQDYTSRINTPAKSREYFETFHKPLVDEAKAASEDGKARVVDIACGPAHELDFLKDDPDVVLYGVDLSIGQLIEGSRERLRGVHLVAGDVTNFPFKEGFADVGIALNAMIYKPAEMLKALKHSLRPGGKGAVNFRNFSNPNNQAFYDFYLRQGGQIYDEELVVRIGEREEKFNLKVVDYRNCADEKIRSLDRQVYFTSEEDIERLIRFVGLEISSHSKFSFASPANPNNEINVYTLRKAT